MQSGKLISHFVVATAGSLLLLASLFYIVSMSGEDVQVGRLLEVIRATSVPLFLFYAATMFLGILVRAIRYRLLLFAAGEANIPNFRDMTLVTAVRVMTVDLLPARLGELVYVALLNRKFGTSVASGLSSLLIAVLLDILVLAPIVILIGLIAGFPNRIPFAYAIAALMLVAGFVVGLRYVLPLFARWAAPWQERGNALVSWLAKITVSFNDAIQTTVAAGVFLRAIGLTVIIRLLKYAGLLMLYKGVTEASFPAMFDMSSLTVLGSLIASEMTASLPIPTLMSFGSWEVGGMTLLAIAGANPAEALLTMLAIHVQTQALDYSVGILALLILLFYIGRTAARERPTAGRRVWQGVTAVLLIAGLVGYIGWRGWQDGGPPRAAGSGGAAATATGIDDLKGFVVWSSNRSGNHDIYRMDLPGREIARLTTHPHTENYARVSPDGSRILFARARQEWQSMRDPKPWDVWLLDLESGEERELAKHGTAPTWSSDGGTVYFLRSPTQIIALDLASGAERVFYESGVDKGFTEPAALENPAIDDNGRISLHFRNRGQPTNAYLDVERNLTIVHADSCQLTWAPSNEYAFFVAKGGKQINQFVRYFPETGEKKVWLDLPGDHSHEYFPRLTRDERFLVFAASSGGHEHDIADYEIFVWQVGSEPADAQRLTFHAGNDSWPDIWISN